MADLIERLRAHLDEDERVALAASSGPWTLQWSGQDLYVDSADNSDPWYVAEWTFPVRTWEPEASADRADCDTADPEHIARHHPARTLRWVTAARQILDAAIRDDAQFDAVRGCGHNSKEIAAGLCPTWSPDQNPIILALASVYGEEPTNG